MSRKSLGVGLGFFSLVLVGGAIASPRQSAQEILENMLSHLDPHLIRQAEENGLYDRAEYPVLREINPFFLRGDFNGDGGMDIAFWVTEKATGLPGVAILHSTLDTLFVFGAGHRRPCPSQSENVGIRVDTWHLLEVGHVEDHPYGDIPEIDLTEASPFTFKRETLEFVHLGKSAFVFYWAEGQYWEFWTAD